MFTQNWPTFVGIGIMKEYEELAPDDDNEPKLKSASYETKLVRVNPDKITVIEEGSIRDEIVEKLGKSLDIVEVHIQEGFQGVKLLALGTINDCLVPNAWDSEENCEELSEWINKHAVSVPVAEPLVA